MFISDEYEDQLRAIAHTVCEIPSLREDFMQEMRLTLLRLPDGHRTAWYLVQAKNRALDWLRRELGCRRSGRGASKASGSLGWELVARLPELFDQDPPVLAANLGWE